MHISFLINGLGVGGAETQVIALSQALTDLGHEVSVITMNNDLRLKDRLNAKVYHFDLGIAGASSMWSAWNKLVAYIKTYQPEVLHAHLFQANILSRLLKWRFPKLKVVNTTHCSYDLSSRSYNPYSFYRWTKRWVDYHSAVSQVALEQLYENNSAVTAKSSVLYNGLPVDKYKVTSIATASSTPFKWLAIGRLIPLKDYPNLFQACQILRAEGISFQLDIAGDGPEKDNLQQTIEAAGLSDSVRLLGFVSDIPQLLSQYNAYVICSTTEGLPMALLEAMASGLLVVGTAVGEVPVIISKAKGGRVVPIGDSKALARAMAGIQQLTDSEKRDFSQQNKTFIDNHFDLTTVTNQWLDIYAGIIKAG